MDEFISFEIPTDLGPKFNMNSLLKIYLQSSGYCWCVDELSGQPMSGTSVLNARPKCNGASGEEELLRSIGVANLVREWKKCPQPRKRDFQERLLDKLTNEMTSATVDLSYLFGNENAHLTIEERVAKWKFGELDKNTNGVSEGLITSHIFLPFCHL